MAKRFTETNKWRDRWFLSLSMVEKLAWSYVLDECDHAGIIELVEPIANMQIGCEVDWNAFFERCGDRVQQIEEGKFWIKAFVDFQYGGLNPENRVHKSVIRRLEMMGLGRGLEGPSKDLKTKTKTKINTKTKTKTPPEDSMMEFPIQGGGVWYLTREIAAEMKERFPKKNRKLEYDKALDWLQEDTKHLKTESGMKRFLARWLERSEDAKPVEKVVTGWDLQEQSRRERAEREAARAAKRAAEQQEVVA